MSPVCVTLRVSRVAMREWTLAIITPMEGNMSGRATTTCSEGAYWVYAETSNKYTNSMNFLLFIKTVLALQGGAVSSKQLKIFYCV